MWHLYGCSMFISDQSYCLMLNVFLVQCQVWCLPYLLFIYLCSLLLCTSYFVTFLFEEIFTNFLDLSTFGQLFPFSRTFYDAFPFSLLVILVASLSFCFVYVLSCLLAKCPFLVTLGCFFLNIIQKMRKEALL